MSTFFYVPQYFTTQLSVAGGIDDTQTTGIVLQDISGVDATKPKYNEMMGGGSPRTPLTIKNVTGTTKTILDKQTAGKVTLNYVTFQNVNSLDASTIYAVNSIDGGNNLNITFGEIPGRNKKADFFMLME